MPLGQETWKYLDGEVLFKKFAEMGKGGSYNKLVAWCFSNNVMNETTGRPPSRAGVRWAMWMWALRHPDEAKAIYANAKKSYGLFLTDEQWEHLLDTRAKSLMSEVGYQEWRRERDKVSKPL